MKMSIVVLMMASTVSCFLLTDAKKRASLDQVMERMRADDGERTLKELKKQLVGRYILDLSAPPPSSSSLSSSSSSHHSSHHTRHSGKISAEGPWRSSSAQSEDR